MAVGPTYVTGTLAKRSEGADIERRGVSADRNVGWSTSFMSSNWSSATTFRGSNENNRRTK
jgi:hypothetical protein